MNLKSSRRCFCNGTVIRNDIIRFWPLWGILFLGLQVNTLSVFSNGIGVTKEYTGALRQLNLACNGVQGMYMAASPLLIAVVSIVTAVLVFGYLFDRRETYLLHSFPVSRREFFCSHFLSGLMMITVPYIITYILIGCISAALGVNLIPFMLGIMLEVLLMIVFFYALACLVVMLSGNTAISIVIYGVINVLVIGFLFLVDGAINYFINDVVSYNMTTQMSSVLSRVYYRATPVNYFGQILEEQAADSPDGVITFFLGFVHLNSVGGYWGDFMGDSLWEFTKVPWKQIGSMAWYLIPAAAFLALAYYLYRKRALERAGDTLAFPWGKVVFHWVFTVCGSFLFVDIMYALGLYSMRDSLGTYRNLFLLGMALAFVGCVCCYLISNMIIQKTFRIWRNLSFIQLGICIVCVLGLMLAARYECYQRSVPDAREIKEIDIQIISGMVEGGKITVQRQEEISELVQAAREYVKSAEDMPIGRKEGAGTSFDFDFDMGEKGSVKLYADFMGEDDYTEQYDKIYSVINRPETMMEKIFSKDYQELEEGEYTFGFYYYNRNDTSESIEDRRKLNRHREEFFRALKADAEAGNIVFGNMTEEDDDCRLLTISVHRKIEKSGKSADASHEELENEIPIKNCENFWKLYDSLK